MYSDEQYNKALEVYKKIKSVTKIITILRYPARRQTLYNLDSSEADSSGRKAHLTRL